MAEYKTVEVELLKKLLSYSPETGKLYWRPRDETTSPRPFSFNTRHAHTEAGCLNDKGYVLVSIKENRMRAHRVIYAMMTGSWPEEVDHINGNRADNRWGNLRSVSHKTNRANTYGWSKKTSSRFIGVCRQPDCDRWKAQVSINGKAKHIGLFQTEVEAAKARDAIAFKLNPNAKLNFPKDLT